MRADLIPYLLDFNPGRIGAQQVAGEKARLFREIIGRKLMIHATASKRALMRGHTDDRAALVVLIQGFDVRERVIEFIECRAARFEVVQPLRPFIMDKACALSATSDHPIDLGNLQIKDRPWPRFPTQRVSYFGVAPYLFSDRIEAGEMHGDERHFLERDSKAALRDFAVVIRGRDLPVTRIAPLTDRIE